MHSLRNLCSRRFSLNIFIIFSRGMSQPREGQVEFSKDNKTVMYTTTMPLLPYRSGLLAMEKISQMSELINSIILRDHPGDNLAAKARFNLANTHGLIDILRSQQLQILPAFYEHMKPNAVLTFHVSVRDVGQKSITFKAKTSTVDGTLLTKGTYLVIPCNHDLQAVGIPPDSLEMFKKLATCQDRYKMSAPFHTKPEHVFTTKSIVRANDLNTTYHVNQAQYISYILDAAVMAVRKGDVYSDLKQDIAYAMIDEININYTKELLLQDELSIETWQDETTPLKICFEISVKSQIASQASILLQKPLLKLSPSLKKRFPRVPEY